MPDERDAAALPAYLTADIAQAAGLLHRSRYALALTGAGLSKESGIPTFRGEGGLWTRDGEPPMNAYQLFMRDPAAWWRNRLDETGRPDNELANAIATAAPNPGHDALVALEREGYLRWTVTQNIDNLHSAAGQERLLEIHGNRTLLRCTECGARLRPEMVDTRELPPRCDRCGGMIKSDTVMFGEPIPRETLHACFREAERADLMLVVGTTALVTPAADLPAMVYNRGGALIEVNVDETVLTPYCAVSLRGASGRLLPLLLDAVRTLAQTAPDERGAGLRGEDN
jgi:NAD-dependent deacetylase